MVQNQKCETSVNGGKPKSVRVVFAANDISTKSKCGKKFSTALQTAQNAWTEAAADWSSTYHDYKIIHGNLLSAAPLRTRGEAVTDEEPMLTSDERRQVRELLRRLGSPKASDSPAPGSAEIVDEEMGSAEDTGLEGTRDEVVTCSQ
ncbi:hypothetical protein TruAng_004701 [Truncatella angustata]|nr:hypothetical protein TruAng_004701 [Truncatella angustata]